MLITTDQIRAARAMLNWNQAELARRAGLARATIVNIENGKQLPEMKTVQIIAETFDAAGVEFSAHEGVGRKHEDVKIYRGNFEFCDFFDEVCHFSQTKGGTIFVSNVDERQWLKNQGDYFGGGYVQKMEKAKKNHDFRIMTKENDFFMPASSYAQYRWVPEKDFAAIPFHVYDDRLSIFLFLDEPIIISLRDQTAADIFREKFLQQWKNTIKPPMKGRVTKW